jgi:hypothetical protein
MLGLGDLGRQFCYSGMRDHLIGRMYEVRIILGWMIIISGPEQLGSAGLPRGSPSLPERGQRTAQDSGDISSLKGGTAAWFCRKRTIGAAASDSPGQDAGCCGTADRQSCPV